MKPDQSYHNQRRDRLSDVVGDYLTDESLTAQDFYRDLMAEVQSLSLIHISEPTRRRGISYAVFCLKKKK